MATLIIYMTTHGCTEKATRMLMNSLNDDINLVNLDGFPDPNLSLYDRVIIGGSIHMGEIQKGVKKYCERNMDALLTKKVGLFLCCMFDGDIAKKQFEDAYPLELRNHAASIGLFGGEITFDKMNVLEKMIVKKVAKIDQDVSKLNQLAIKEFAQKLSG
jgi:menaquinone-dependent protoporphyrinogen oxidase